MAEAYSKPFIKDNFIVLVGVALVYMKGIIVMPIIIKTVGVAIYGGFVLLSSVLAIVFGISSFGAGFRAKRFLPSAVEATVRRKLFYPQFFFQLISIMTLSLGLVLLNKQIDTSIFKHEISYSVLIIPLYLFFYFLYSQGADYFRYTSRVKFMMAATLSLPYIHIGLILIFFYYQRYINVNILVLTQTLSALLVAAPCFWCIFREIGVRVSFYNIKDLVSDIKLGFPFVLGFIMDFILAASDRYFIAFYLTVSAVGYYNPAYVLGSLIIFIPKAMGTVLPQLLSKAVDNDSGHEAQKMLNYAIKIFLLIGIPFVFGSIVLAKPILVLLANDEVAQSAWIVTPIVALGTLFYGLNIILSNVLFVRLKAQAMLNMNLLASAFSLLANLVFLYFFRSIIVAAITTLFSYFVVFVFTYKAAVEDWPVDLQPAVIIKSILASFLMGGLLFLLSSNAIAVNDVCKLTGELILGAFVYIAGLLTFRTFSKKEWQFVKAYVFRG